MTLTFRSLYLHLRIPGTCDGDNTDNIGLPVTTHLHADLRNEQDTAGVQNGLRLACSLGTKQETDSHFRGATPACIACDDTGVSKTTKLKSLQMHSYILLMNHMSSGESSDVCVILISSSMIELLSRCTI